MPRPGLGPQPPPVQRPGILLTAETFKRFAPRAKPELVAVIADKGNEVLARFAINANASRMCHFLAQVSHECAGFSVAEENLNYSAARMVQVFGPGKHSARITEAEAGRLAGNKAAFAERIYGLGNPTMARRLGNTEPGDGYRYRGRGFMQITGRANYREMGRKIGVDLEANPDLAAQPLYALMTAAAFWDNRDLNGYADRNDLEGITKRINGGLNGLEHRKSNFAAAKGIFAQGAARPTECRSVARPAGNRLLRPSSLAPSRRTKSRRHRTGCRLPRSVVRWRRSSRALRQRSCHSGDRNSPTHRAGKVPMARARLRTIRRSPSAPSKPCATTGGWCSASGSCSCLLP